MEAIFDQAKRIKMIIFDVDGVLTDGTLYLADDGQEYKSFNSLDGHGMKMLKNSGVALAIITGRTSKVVLHRAQNLGVDHLYQGCHDKLETYQELLNKIQLEPAETAFMGDDVIDLPVMRRCGLALCVPAAPALVKQHAHYVTENGGGRGAVREVCEIIMRAQGTYDDQMAPFLR